MDYKKILLVILFLAVSVGIGVAIYFMFFRAAPIVTPEVPPVNAPPTGLVPAAPGAPTPGVPTVPPTLPTPPVARVAAGGVTQATAIAEAPTVGASLSAAGRINYYNRYDEKFYRMNADGSVTSLSSQQFHNVDQATFNPKGDKAIIEYPDGSNIYYDFTTGKQVTLPKHWESFAFSPAGDKIEAKSLGTDPSNRFLVVANPDGSDVRAVQELGDNASKVQVAWSPNNQIIAMSATGAASDMDTREVYFIGQNNENFKSLSVNGLGFQPQWAPTGQQLIYSAAASSANYKPQLWIVDASGNDIGKNRRSLNVNTWADKCAFQDDRTLYCAVPNEMNDGAGLQPTLYDQTPDTIYRIDVETGIQTKIAEPEGGRTVGKMMIAPDGKSLYFTDKNSGFLQKIILKE
ncbi:MAG: hypothetical protein PHT12_03980 [Patescibacteria group bacterium]|nr:hypothetical protein [Patescibacteria group bacterium]